MEISAVGGVHLAQSENSSAKSNCSIDGLLNLAPVSTTQSTSQNVSEDNHEEKFPVVSVHQDGIKTNIAISQNVSKKESIARNSNSKIRPKSSSKLSQIIETCKKLQAHQNAVNMRQENEVVLSVTPVEECSEQIDCGVSEVDASFSTSEPTVNKPKLTPDDFCLHKDNGNDSSSNSINLSPLSNDSSILSSQFTSESASDLVLKKFLFLFRPSDHEVLVRCKGVNMYRCNVCGGMYRQKFSLKRHFLRSHINFQYLSKADISNCKIAIPENYVKHDSNAECGKMSNGRKKFKSSNAIFLENNRTRVMPGLYICHICVGVKFDVEKDLRDHYDEHSDTERKIFQCDKCSASFFKKQILSRHLASHGEKVSQKVCRRCGTECSSKVEYQKHLASHSSGRVCKFCSKILSTSANRKRHESLHLGVKPYHCTHCGTCFAQSMDLDRHLRKQHNALCHFCDDCCKLFPSQASLNVHMLEAHSGAIAKKAESSCSPEPALKPSVAKSASVPTAVPVKLKVCFVCKRSFQTFYAMMKHRSQAHPFHTKRRRNKKTMKQKMAAKQAAKELNQGIKVRRQYVKTAQRNSNFPNAPVRRGRPRIDRSVEFERNNERPDRKFLTKREKELAKKDEDTFYCKLSERIADNLINCVDGKASQLSLKQYNFNDQQYTACNFEERGCLPWSNYNFPNGYDVDHALKTRGQEVNRLPENLSSRDKCLFATGLNRVQNSVQTPIKVPVENPIETLDTVPATDTFPLSGFHKQKVNIEERKKLIGREISVICVCYICNERFESNEAFKEHCVNNHPNVHCPSIEFENNKETPPVIPDNLCKHHISPEGVLFTCNVPPPLCDRSVLRCTKCKSDFKTTLELHSHIVECGNLKFSPRHVWKFNLQKRIKRTMRSRMSSAQQAAVKAYYRDFKTPEKHSPSSKDRESKLNEKNSRSAERSQFYKSGRLQTTSFTVDMNYFKTKPVKPVTTVSKRGRKSYASLSYRYRNASMQSSTSLECSNCKEVFSSQSTLNLHLQSHCIRALFKRKEMSFHTTDSSQNKMANICTVKYIAAASSTISSSKMPALQGDRLASSRTNSPLSFSSNVLCLSTTSENNSRDTPNIFNTQKAAPVVNSKVSNLPETAIDLSKNSNDKNAVSLDLSNKMKNVAASKKSALEIAMEAIHEYYQNSEDNEHISKLQKTVENLTVSSTIVSSVLSKPPIQKKVGRPKKVKRLGPFRYRKNLSQSTNEGTSSKSISKSEESVKRQESNVKSDLPSSPKTSTFKPIDASGNNQNVMNLNTPFGVNFAQPAICATDKTINKDINTDSEASKASNKNITINTDKTFVPIIIFGNQHKPNKAFVLTDDNMDKLKQNVSESSSMHKHPLLGKATDKTSEKIIQFDDALTREKATDLPSSSKSESPGKKSDKSRRSSGSQGRISPSLESIVNSIKQKLHSQEQETSPNDDVAISWLEDEKFEIPPSRQRLKLPLKSNSNSSLSLDSEQFLTLSGADASSSQVNSDSTDLQHNSRILFDSVTKLTSTNTDLEKEIFAPNLSQTVESTSCESLSFPSDVQENTRSGEKSQDPSSISVCTSKNSELVSIPDNKSSEILVDEVSEVQNNNLLVSTIEKDLGNSEISVTKSDKRRRKKTVNFCAATKKPLSTQLDDRSQEVRRRPGRPRKKAAELETKTTASGDNINLLNTVANSKFTTQDSVPPEENAALAQCEMEANVHDDVEKETFISITHGSQETDRTESTLSHCHQESSVIEPESDESQNRPCCSSAPDIANCQLESNSALSKMSSLRAFRAKLKPTQAPCSEAPSLAGSNLTTEFGKSLASRMKEKMRLSFENASIENLIRSEECNSINIPDASPSDAISQISDDDSEYIKAIKKELESSDPTKKHSCPFCMLEFAYLTNFRRHLHACRTREEKKVESIPNTSTTVVQHLPKKDEVEHSMLHLLRHQNRQTAMLQEAEKSTGSKVESKFRTYSCNVCHRIYLSLFKLLQHQVTHKLVSQDSSEQSALGTDVDDSKDLNEIEKYSDIHELEEGANNNSEICKDIEQSHDFKFMNDQESVKTESSHNEVMSNQSMKQMGTHFVDDVQRESDSEIVDDPQNAISLILDSVNETEKIQSSMPKNCDVNDIKIHSDATKVIKTSDVNKVTENSNASEVTMTMNVNDITKNSITIVVTETSDANGVTKISDSDDVTKKSNANGVAKNSDADGVIKNSSSNKLIKYANTDELAVKCQEQPVKRRRGRPFGWRKNASNIEENKAMNVLKRNFKKVGNTKAVLFGMKKKDEKHVRGPIKRGRRKFLFTRIKSKHTKPVSNKMKEVVSDKQFELTPDSGSEAPKPISSSEDIEIKSENSDGYIFQDLPITNEELLKFSFKQSLMKGIAITKNLVSSNVSKCIFHTKVSRGKQNRLVGSASSRNAPIVKRNKLNQVMKRPRGRPPLTLKSEEPIIIKTEESIIVKTEESILEESGDTIMVRPENSLKRRPGRPPKNLNPTPSTSHSKGFQPGGTRNFRKMMTRYIPEDSSDSESDIQEKLNVIPKKKVLKKCPICKDKFSASLILYRHIQLVHSRRAEGNAIKSETSKTPKIFEKHIPKSFEDSSANVTKDLKKFSPKTATVDKYDGSTRGNKKSNPLTKDVNSNTSPTRVFKKISPKSLVDNFHTHGTKVYRKTNAKAVDLNDSGASTTKVLRKVIPKLLAVDNSDTDGTKLYKKSNAKSMDLNDSDASTTKVFRKVVPKSLLVDNSDTDGVKVYKRTNKAADFDSNGSTTKFFRKVVSKSLTIDNSDSGGAKVCKISKATDLEDSNTSITKIFKRVTPKLLVVDNSDADEASLFKKVGRKAICANNSEAGDAKVSKRIIQKSIGITKAGANRTKLMKTYAKSISSDNSDTDSAKGLKRGVRKLITVYNSDTENFKDLKKGILKSVSVDNSDADSDFSVKTDITPSKNFRVCPICKEKFAASLLLSRHIQMVHSRRSTSTSSKSSESPSLNKEVHPSLCPPMKVKNSVSSPAKMKSLPSSPTKIKNRLSLPTKMKNLLSLPTAEMIDSASRSALSRQCVKPLPPLKRKWSKKEQSQDQIKKTKLN